MNYDIKIRKRFAIIFCCFLLFCSNFAIGCGTDKNSGEPVACTISIDCRTVLDNMDELKETKKEFIPNDGWILSSTSVKFTTGETVFDILKDICEKNRIQISSRYTPLYNNYYVEGINQLYEFDCGKKSGWMYSVNGVFPNYGASSYKPKDGDKIEWVYTCNLGDDVGNHYEEK